MPYFADRVKTTSSSTGQSAITLSSTGATGYQAFPSSLDGETVGYVIESGTDWEIGTGTYTHSSLNLTRSLRSSSTGALLSLSSSDAPHTVFLTPAAQDLQIVEAFSSTSDLPSASSNHGRIYHVHGEGAMYFAHGGSWHKLANATAATTSADGLMSAADKTKLDGIETSADVTDTANVVGALTAGTNITIAADGTISSTASGGSGIALTDLSVTQNSASGSGSLTYNNTSGVFSYTPPASSGGSSSSGSSLSNPIRQTEYTGTATSTFNASSTPALPAFTVGNIQVFLNGSKLADSDFTEASDGSQVQLGSPCAASDVVTIVEYGAPFASEYSATTFIVGTSSEYNTTSKILTTDYTVGKVAVYLNGVKLIIGTNNDFTATDGSSINLTGAAPVTGDTIEVVEYGSVVSPDVLRHQEITASANQTVFPVTSIVNASNVVVYFNGSRLLTSEYSVDSTQNEVTLQTAAAAGDIVIVDELGTTSVDSVVQTLTDLTDTPSSLGTAGQILQVNSGATALEFADASGGGVTVYDNTGDLPSSGNTDGDLAWVKDVTGSGALKAFYIWDGSAWKRVPTGTDQGPLITTEPPTSQLNLQATSTVTMVASDPEGFPVTYSIDYNTTNNALPSQLSAATSINQSTGVFTFTPATSVSGNGTFKARLNASDGARSTSRFVDFILDYKQSQKSTSTGWNFAPGQMWTDQTPTSNVVTKLFFTRIGTSNIIYEWAVSNDDISTLTNASTMSSTTYNNTYDFYDAGSVSVDGSKLLCSYNGYIYGYTFSTPFDRTSLSYDGRVYVGSTSHAVSALWYDNGSKIRYQNSGAVYTASASTAYDITTVGSFTSSSPASTYRKTPNQQWAVPSTAEAGNDSDATIADLYYGYWTDAADYGSALRYGTAANYTNSPVFDLTGTNALGGSDNPFTGSNFNRGKILFVSPDGSEIFVYADNSSGNNQTSSTSSRRIARYKLNTAGTLAQLSDVASF